MAIPAIAPLDRELDELELDEPEPDELELELLPELLEGLLDVAVGPEAVVAATVLESDVVVAEASLTIATA